MTTGSRRSDPTSRGRLDARGRGRGARVRRCEGAKVRRCEGAKVRGSPAALARRPRVHWARHRADAVGRFWHAGRDQPRARGDVVPGEHPVVDAQHNVGQREIVVPRCGETLEGETPVVTDVAGDAALKRRQPGDRIGGVRREPGADRVERIARPGALNHGDRIRHQKRIASKPCRTGGAVEEQAIRQALEPLATLHWSWDGCQLLDQRCHLVSDPRSPVPAP